MNGQNAADDFFKKFFDLFQANLGFSPWMLVKLIYLVGLGIYLAFAVIVVRQVDLMTKTLQGDFESSLKLIAWLHLIVALGVFVFALVIL